MLAYGRRTKKLTVAFQFLFANQAAWKCDTCRSHGLEKKRRCGWLTFPDEAPRTVWARNGVAVSKCPKSLITGESLSFLEDYQAGKSLGSLGNIHELPARSVDAFTLLEQLVAKERSNE
jgi:hypothetical protein